MSIRGPWDARSEHGVRINSSNRTDPRPFLHDSQSPWLTYETFYGLKEQPFSLSSNPAFFYQSRSHASTYQDLLAGIRRRERLSVLTGDIGTGKTTLCRTVLQDLDRKTFCAFVPDPFASREDLLKVLLMDFGVMSLEDLTSGRLRTATRTELSYLLYDFLGTLAPLQAFAVVIIDEAQNLSVPLLEEIRILSDSDGRDRQLQVVLVGQLELRQKLKLAEMRQVDQRVSVRCHLEPLSGDAVAGYVAHRLSVAGGTPDRVGFSPEALDLVFEASNGVPRLINRICDRALHQGSILRSAIINREMVQAAMRELGESAPARSAEHSKSATAPVVAVPASAQEPPDAPVFAERVDQWLATVDGEPTPATESPRDRSRSRPSAVKAGDRSGSISLPRPAKESRQAARRFEPGIEPTTHIERLTRYWLRTAAIATFAMMALGAVVVSLSWMETLSADLTETPLPALPPRPPVALPLAFTTPLPSETVQWEVPRVGRSTIAVAPSPE